MVFATAWTSKNRRGIDESQELPAHRVSSVRRSQIATTEGGRDMTWIKRGSVSLMIVLLVPGLALAQVRASP